MSWRFLILFILSIYYLLFREKKRVRGLKHCWKVQTFTKKLSILQDNVKSISHTHCSRAVNVIRILTAPFNKLWTLKFKAHPTNAFFASVNQVFGGSSQFHNQVVMTIRIIGGYGPPKSIDTTLQASLIYISGFRVPVGVALCSILSYRSWLRTSISLVIFGCLVGLRWCSALIYYLCGLVEMKF